MKQQTTAEYLNAALTRRITQIENDGDSIATAEDWHLNHNRWTVLTFLHSLFSIHERYEHPQRYLRAVQNLSLKLLDKAELHHERALFVGQLDKSFMDSWVAYNRDWLYANRTTNSEGQPMTPIRERIQNWHALLARLVGVVLNNAGRPGFVENLDDAFAEYLMPALRMLSEIATDWDNRNRVRQVGEGTSFKTKADLFAEDARMAILAAWIYFDSIKPRFDPNTILPGEVS